MHLEAIVAGKSIAHHHCHSVWKEEPGGGCRGYMDIGDSVSD